MTVMAGCRAKFYVRSVTAIAGATKQGSVELSPVTRGAANARWASATPSGQINLTITNSKAWEWFAGLLGQELYIDFTLPPADALDPTSHAYVDGNIPESNYGHERCVECGEPEEAHR